MDIYTESSSDFLDLWNERFANFCESIKSCFKRRDTRKIATQYIQGLLSNIDRKNCWQIAESLGYENPYTFQQFLYRSNWDSATLRDSIMFQAAQILLSENDRGVLIVDETGFLKKGNKSVGVKRQYTGTAGRIENSQVGVFLALASNKGKVLIDRALYMPREWMEDNSRLKEASVPTGLEFHTKQCLAQQMLSHAFEQGIQPEWVLGDAVYGSDSKFRRFLEENNQPYVLGVSSQQRLWVNFQQERVDKLCKEIPDEEWIRHSIGSGAKGPRLYDWSGAAIGIPLDSGLQRYILYRRNIKDNEDCAYYLCMAAIGTSIKELSEAAGKRWNIECCFETAKQETGLDEYEVRSWHGWYKHTTLSMAALLFLSLLRATEESCVKKGIN